MSSSGGATIIPLVAYPSANLAAGISTFTLLTATGGDILLRDTTIFVSTPGATITSVSVQTDNTVADIILSAVEGAVANLLAGKNIKAFVTPTIIPVGKRIQYTVAGVAGTGILKLAVTYIPLTAGATLV